MKTRTRDSARRSSHFASPSRFRHADAVPGVRARCVACVTCVDERRETQTGHCTLGAPARKRACTSRQREFAPVPPRVLKRACSRAQPSAPLPTEFTANNESTVECVCSNLHLTRSALAGQQSPGARCPDDCTHVVRCIRSISSRQRCVARDSGYVLQ